MPLSKLLLRQFLVYVDDNGVQRAASIVDIKAAAGTIDINLVGVPPDRRLATVAAALEGSRFSLPTLPPLADINARIATGRL